MPQPTIASLLKLIEIDRTIDELMKLQVGAALNQDHLQQRSSLLKGMVRTLINHLAVPMNMNAMEPSQSNNILRDMLHELMKLWWQDVGPDQGYATTLLSLLAMPANEAMQRLQFGVQVPVPVPGIGAVQVQTVGLQELPMNPRRLEVNECLEVAKKFADVYAMVESFNMEEAQAAVAAPHAAGPSHVADDKPPTNFPRPE